jgi:hypothetical protein
MSRYITFFWMAPPFGVLLAVTAGIAAPLTGAVSFGPADGGDWPASLSSRRSPPGGSDIGPLRDPAARYRQCLVQDQEMCLDTNDEERSLRQAQGRLLAALRMFNGRVWFKWTS